MVILIVIRVIWQVQILDFVEKVPGLEAEICQCSKEESHEKGELCVIGDQGPLKDHRNFWVFNAQIYAFSHILETPFLSLLT